MKCKKQGCNREFETKQGMNMHYIHAHVRTAEEKTRISRKISKSFKKTWSNKPQTEKDEKIRKWKTTWKNRSPEIEMERIRKTRETVNNKPHGIFNCPHPDCEDSNKEFKTTHDMKVHYYQMHIRTPEEYNVKITKMKITKANRPQKEKIERIRKMKETVSNKTPEEKVKIAERKSKGMKIALANKSPEEEAERVRKMKETKGNWTLEQKEAIYLKALATWKKNGRGKIFMGEWYQSISEADIAKLLWETLGCIFIVGVNRQISMKGGFIDFYPRILGCFVEFHVMDSLYENLLVSQRNDYKKRRIIMKNKKGI